MDYIPFEYDPEDVEYFGEYLEFADEPDMLEYFDNYVSDSESPEHGEFGEEDLEEIEEGNSDDNEDEDSEIMEYYEGENEFPEMGEDEFNLAEYMEMGFNPNDIIDFEWGLNNLEGELNEDPMEPDEHVEEDEGMDEETIIDPEEASEIQPPIMPDPPQNDLGKSIQVGLIMTTALMSFMAGVVTTYLAF